MKTPYCQACGRVCCFFACPGCGTTLMNLQDDQFRGIRMYEWIMGDSNNGLTTEDRERTWGVYQTSSNNSGKQSGRNSSAADHGTQNGGMTIGYQNGRIISGAYQAMQSSGKTFEDRNRAFGVFQSSSRQPGYENGRQSSSTYQEMQRETINNGKKEHRRRN